MLNKMILINEIDFNTLEREIFEYGCKCARDMMTELLMRIDDEIAKKRDSKGYRHKGKRKNKTKRILPEKYTKEITEILSAAKASKKEGTGYRYPTTGRIPC